MKPQVGRRRFGAIAGGAAASFVFGDACRLKNEPSPGDDRRLSARPRANVGTSSHGSRLLGLDRGRDAILQLPANAAAAPLPLRVLWHGAGGRGPQEAPSERQPRKLVSTNLTAFSSLLQRERVQ